MKINILKAASLIILFAMSVAPFTSSAESKLVSLRAGVSIDANNTPVPENTVLIPEDGFDTDWDSQPPSIPHEINEDVTSLSENSCMNCHSKENYRQAEAVKIGKSHYYDRDGNRLKQLSSRRYFCVQCHTTQLDVDSLVDNTYQSEK